MKYVCQAPWPHGAQDGCFNADPHPGNILLLEDGQTLGLIDFGQVMYLPQAAWQLFRIFRSQFFSGPDLQVSWESLGVGVAPSSHPEDFRLKLARLIVALTDRKPEEVARYESPMAEIEGTAV